MISHSLLTAAICICTLSYSLATQEGNLTNTSNSNSTVSCDCNSCELPANESTSTTSTTTAGHVIRILNLKTKSDFAFMGLEKTGKKYYDDTGITIEFDYINDKSLRGQELRNQLQNKLPLYDGFVLPSRLVGTAVQYDGFVDLTDIVRTRRELDWNDIFLGWRENVAMYDNRIYMFPIDGDANYMFYRRDILEHFNQTVPRTWDEFAEVGKAVNRKEFKGKTIYGSCLGRKAGEGAGAYWAMDILSSYTQTKGKAQGFLFDPTNLSPLMGEAIAETMRQLELQVYNGHPNEFGAEAGGEPGSINVVAMNGGECAMTINWGDSFSQSYSSDPPSQIAGLMNVARLPGANRVFNRNTMAIEPCTEENCGGLGGQYHEDIGWVNHAPYLAGGGWSAAVNNNIDQERKDRVVDFFVHLCSPEVSITNLVQDANASRADGTGVDPFRASHFNISYWVDANYEKDSVESYEQAVIGTASNPNCAVDIRFAGSDDIVSALGEEIQVYLEMARTNTLPKTDGKKKQLRLQIADQITQRFNKIVKDEDTKPETEYQRDLGLYVKENENLNLIGNVRWVGYSLGMIVFILSLGFGVWVTVNRKHKVVRVSQPIFLLLICLGVMVLSSAIYPLGVDDSIATQEGANAACLSIPWLVSCGFSLVFAALFSKLWRINRVFKAAARMKRVVVTEKDVLIPFAVLMTLNFIILLSWTLVDPPVFERVYIDELTSYGRCNSEGSEWKGFISALAILNFTALIIANVEAYKARSINDELSESKYIGLATLSMLQIFIVGVPLLVIVYQDPSAYFFMWTGIIFIISTSILFLIFIPKILTWKTPAPKKSWSTYGSASGGGAGVSLEASGIISEAEKQDKATDKQVSLDKHDDSETPKDKHVSLLNKQSDRDSLDYLKNLVLEEYNVDITSVISKLLDEEVDERR